MSHTPHGVLTALHTPLASLGADAAVFEFAGVTLALLGAKTACSCTNVQHTANDIVVRPCTAGCEATSDGTNVGAIKIEADALRQIAHLFLSQARIGAGRARLCA
jgi:hypothetical protein